MNISNKINLIKYGIALTENEAGKIEGGFVNFFKLADRAVFSINKDTCYNSKCTDSINKGDCANAKTCISL